jgi:hypothetical protein
MESILAQAGSNAQIASPLLDAVVGGILFAVAMVSSSGPQGMRKALKEQPRGFIVVALLIASAICIATAAYRIVA